MTGDEHNTEIVIMLVSIYILILGAELGTTIGAGMLLISALITILVILRLSIDALGEIIE